MSRRKKHGVVAVIAGILLFTLSILLFASIYVIAGNENSIAGTIGLATLPFQPMLSGALFFIGIVLDILGVVLLTTKGEASS